MQVEFLEDGKRLIARPQGRMDAADGDRFAAETEQLLKARIKTVTIDLDRLEAVSFGGIRAILKFARSLKDQERDIDFLGGGEIVRDALDQAGFDDFFPFTPPFDSNRGKTDGTQ